MKSKNYNQKIIIIGGGPVGLSCALALAIAEFDVCLLIKSEPNNISSKTDYRTSALFSGSIEFLKNLKLWKLCEAQAQAIKTIRLIDDTKNLLRSPEIHFQAKEVGLDIFGFNIPNFVLNDALRISIQKNSKITLEYINKYPHIEITDENAKITLSSEFHFCSPLLIAADGKNSPTRNLAKISVRMWEYSQSALVTFFNHKKDHESISTEFQRLGGSFTIVPLKGRSSSLVWVEKTKEAERLHSLPDAELITEIENNSHGLLGSISHIGPRGIFPITGLKPETFAQNRVALIGEAAHVFPPIGAQGLNLGFRDVAYLVERLIEARNSKQDIGSSKVLSSYNHSRTNDVYSRIYGIDILNGSFLSPYTAPHTIRSLALYGVKMITPLRKKIMNIGVNPPGKVPSLMKEKYDLPS